MARLSASSSLTTRRKVASIIRQVKVRLRDKRRANPLPGTFLSHTGSIGFC